MSPETALAEALAEVWSGADEHDAGAVLDHLLDRGFKVARMRAPMTGEEPLPFPEASLPPSVRLTG